MVCNKEGCPVKEPRKGCGKGSFSNWMSAPSRVKVCLKDQLCSPICSFDSRIHQNDVVTLMYRVDALAESCQERKCHELFLPTLNVKATIVIASSKMCPAVNLIDFTQE